MFDPIKGPPDQYRGPAVGDSTEHGDTWHTAVAKINAGFERVKDAFENGYRHIVYNIDTEAREEIAKLKDIVEALHNRIDALTTPGIPSVPAEPGAATDPQNGNEQPAGLVDPAT